MTNRPYITCRELISFIADYLDGVLAEEARFEFDRHLAVCPSCVAYLASYRESIRLAKAASEEPQSLADEAPAELIEAIIAASRR